MTHSPQAPEPLATSRPVISVVDDEEQILDLVRRVCAPMNWHVQTFTRAGAFLEVADPDTPGCLILDYMLPDMSGLQLLEQLHQREIWLPVIFISGRAQVSTAVAAFKAGTMDFLEKPFQVDELYETIKRAVLRDREGRRERARLKAVAGRIKILTPRESQVMDLVVRGMANKAIAAELGVSPKTVEVHRANVMQKMQAGSLAELVQMAILYRNAEAGASG
jgi:FixJ family two-component response regulator